LESEYEGFIHMENTDGTVTDMGNGAIYNADGKMQIVWIASPG